MKDNSDMLALGSALKSAFSTQNREAISALLHDDVVWRLPGDNAVSGDAVGVAGIFDRFATLAGYGVTIRIEDLAVNASGVAMTLHNTGSHDGRLLDERLITTVAVRDGKAARLDTYLSDMPMMNAYFV